MDIEINKQLDTILLHTQAALVKTSSLLTESTNPFLHEKISSHIDGHKIETVRSMYKLANMLVEKQAFAISLPVALSLAAVPALGFGGVKYVEHLGRSAAKGFKEETEAAAADWKDKAMIAVPSALLALGTAAKAGFLGDSAQGYVEGLGDKAKKLLGGSTKKEEKKDTVSPEEGVSRYAPLSQAEEDSFPLKVAVAKTYCKLERALDSSEGEDRMKISSALEDCSATLFDLMMYFP